MGTKIWPQIGQTWVDNDPRCHGRKGVVVAVDSAGQRARLKWASRHTWVSFKRLWSDSQTGYTLIDHGGLPVEGEQ